MKALIAKSNRSHLLSAFCFGLLCVCAFKAEGLAQALSQPNSFLPPPKANLSPVHWPDLSKLEPEVREQLVSLQAGLVATAQNPHGTDAILSEAYGLMGTTYQAYSLSSAARECYLNAVKLAPRDFRWVYLLGVIDQREDRIDDAIRRYRFARNLRPDYVAVPVNLGNIFLQLNRLVEAHENFAAALAIDGNSAAALYGLGQVALSQQKYVEAVKHFERALAVTPGANRIHYSLAMGYRGLGDTEKAKNHLAQQGTVGVRVNDPLFDGLQDVIKGERLHLVRAMAAIEARRYPEAIDEFRKVVSANPNNITAHVNLGVALNLAGDGKSAARHFAEALKIDPNNLRAHYNLAIIRSQESKHEEAVSHLQFMLKLDPNDLGARLFLGRELLKGGRREAALTEFTYVFEADANNEAALLDQVTLLQQMGRHKQALNSLQRGRELYPRKGQTALFLARLLATSPQFDLRDGAQSLLLARMIFDVSGSPEHGALVALALAELGRCSEAAEWQRRMVAAAQHQKKTEMAVELNARLKHYEGRQTCRPTGEVAGLTPPN